jgi:sulfate/thiosulfate transport system substrate-binding protein
MRDDVVVVTPNPKTSGGARWNYLAAWGYALKAELGDLALLSEPAQRTRVESAVERARQFVTALYRRVPVLDSGARGATNTFVQREIGDVLLTWENEAFLAAQESGADRIELIVPSLSIRAEPPVAVVSKVARKRGTVEVAEAYLQHLYSAAGQTLAAKHFYRPALPELVPSAELGRFQQLELFSVEQISGSWASAQATHFDDGGIFDQIYRPGN